MGQTGLPSRLHSIEKEICELKGVSEEVIKMYVIREVKRLKRMGSGTLEETMTKKFIELRTDSCPQLAEGVLRRVNKKTDALVEGAG